MRRLAVLLIILNGAVFLYWRYVSPAPLVLPNAVAPAQTPPKIMLASERPAPTPECRSLGPLPNRQVLTQVMSWLSDRFGALTEREATIEAPPAYRVQLSTQSADQAARIAQRLRGAGLSDIVVLAPEPGETTVTVSMGLFGERANAERRVGELHRHMVEASIRPIERHASQWWIDFTALETPDLAELAHTLPIARGSAIAPCEVTIPGEEPASAPTATPDPSKGGPAPKLGGVRSSGAAV